VQDDGTLVFYDFGMSGYVDPFIQEKIVDFYVAVADQDIQGILDTLVEVGTLSPEADRQVMGEVLELAIADARGEDIEQYRVQQIVQQVEDTIYDFPFRLPSNLALVLRVATVVEGVCVTLDPEFDFIEVATGYLREQGFVEDTARQYVEERADEVNQAARAALRAPPKADELLDLAIHDDLEVKVDLRDSQRLIGRFTRRLVYGLITASFVLATAILYVFDEFVAAGVTTAMALVTAVLLYYSFRRSRGIRAQPQFTRQSMRERDRER
jgi:predicted unusual protein kinase regulating ubiquinone biosynthesis (AarF/ABC1/UbiB family)